MKDIFEKFTIRAQKSFRYKPKEDVTPYELALLVPAFSLLSQDVGEFIEKLPECARRHFEEIKEK